MNRQVFRGTSLKATPEAVYLTNTTFFEVVDSMPELKSAEGLLITPTHQTITTAQLSAARAAGGDPMDLDPKDGNFISMYGTAQHTPLHAIYFYPSFSTPLPLIKRSTNH